MDAQSLSQYLAELILADLRRRPMPEPWRERAAAFGAEPEPEAVRAALDARLGGRRGA
jgi:hypothetical protein